MQLSPQELQTIRIERVEVIYKPDAFIQWEKVALPYVEKHSLRSKKPWKQVMLEDEEAAKNEYQTFINSPEGKRYMQSVLTGELKKRVGAAIVPKFQGTRPVVLEITVKLFLMPNTVYRGFFGTTPMLAAVTRLKDASTGKELAKLDRAALGSTGSSQPQSEVVSVPLYDRHGNVIPGGPSTFYTIDVPNLSPEDPKAPKLAANQQPDVRLRLAEGDLLRNGALPAFLFKRLSARRGGVVQQLLHVRRVVRIENDE
ncbi:MAG: hypothetical protein P8Y36_03025, partial [Alphaproteobacteria bacterium]